MLDQLRRKMRAVRRRLQWIELCRTLLKVGAWTAGALLIFVVVSKLIMLPITLVDVAPWVGGTAFIWFAVWTWVKRIRIFEAASQADESLGLKERLSSAVLIGEPSSEPEIAVVQDAAKKAEAIRPRRSFPMKLGRELRWAAGPLVVCALTFWLMPQFDLLAKVEEKQEEKRITLKAKKEAAKRLEELAEEMGKVSDIHKPEMAKEVERELHAIAHQLNEQKIDRQQAMAEMAKISERLDARKSDLQRKLAKPTSLNSKGEGRHTKDLQKALRQGNFSKAAKLMSELKKKLQDGNLNEEEKKALQKELKAMASKLGEESALAEALAEIAEKMEGKEFNVALGMMELAEEELMNLEAMLAELKMLEGLGYDMDARSMALGGKPGLCAVCGAVTLGGVCLSCGAGMSPWAPGDSRKWGNGMGRSGIGRGGIANKEEGTVGFRKTRIKGDLQAGRIIAKMKVPGQQAPGEISTQYEELRLEYSQKAEDTIENEMLPLEHRSLIRTYYDAIKSDGWDDTAEN